MSAEWEPRADGGGRVSYLGRLLDLLDAVCEDRSGPAPTLAHVAERAGIPISTASRLSRLLMERGYLRRGPGQTLIPGPQLVRVGLRSLHGLTDTARFDAALASLAETTGESVSAGVLVDDRIVLVARKESEHPLRMVVRVGDVIRPDTSAMGKAILSLLPDERRREVLSGAVGEQAGEVLERLEPELEEARTAGYACDEQVFAVGLRCRAAPSDHDGLAFAAISIAGPAARFTPEIAEQAVPALLDQTAALSLPEAARP